MALQVSIHLFHATPRSMNSHILSALVARPLCLSATSAGLEARFMGSHCLRMGMLILDWIPCSSYSNFQRSCLFLLVGTLFDRHKTRLIRYHAGCARTMPLLALLCLFFTLLQLTDHLRAGPYRLLELQIMLRCSHHEGRCTPGAMGPAGSWVWAMTKMWLCHRGCTPFGARWSSRLHAGVSHLQHPTPPQLNPPHPPVGGAQRSPFLPFSGGCTVLNSSDVWWHALYQYLLNVSRSHGGLSGQVVLFIQAHKYGRPPLRKVHSCQHPCSSQSVAGVRASDKKCMGNVLEG